MDGWQLAIQGGALAIVMFVIARLGLALIAKWRESEAARNAAYIAAEKERTVVLTSGLAAIVTSVQHHSLADLASHAQIGEAVARVDGKLDAVLDRYTPVHGVPAVPVGEFDDHPTPTTDVESPFARRAQQTRVVRARGEYRIGKKPNGEE